MTTVPATNQNDQDDACQCCGTVVSDSRMLLMGCGVLMEQTTPTSELPLTPLSVLTSDDRIQAAHLYTMVVCKACRAEWLEAVWQWWQTKEEERQRNTPQDIGALLQERYEVAYRAFHASHNNSEAYEALVQGSEVLTITHALGHTVCVKPDFPARGDY